MGAIEKEIYDVIGGGNPITSVNGLSDLDNIVRDVIQIEKDIAERTELAKGQIKRLQNYVKQLELEQEEATNSYKELARPFVAAKLLTSKKKSIKLPSGVVGFRKRNHSLCAMI